MQLQRYEGNGRMSQAVVHNGVLYLCGQTGTPGDDVAAQMKTILGKIDALLNRYGSDKEHLLSAVIYIQHINMFQEMNAVWDAWLVPGCEPVRTCVEAKANDLKKLVEITVTAALK